MSGDFDDARRHVTLEAVRGVLMDMVDIASPTGGEIDMARYIAGRLAQSGIASELQLVDEDRPNAVGLMAGSGEGYNLLLTGHMDTSYRGDEAHLVGEGYKAVAIERDGWVWGLGSMNMKSGLAAAIVAMEAITRAGVKLKGDLSLGAVVGEIEKAPVEEFQGTEFSGYGTGSKYLVTHGVTADFAILGEPTGLKICTANMGCMWVRITLSGTVAHSAFARQPGQVNSIELMADLQRDLREWARAYEAANEFRGEHANVTLGAIRGGERPA